MSPSAGERRLRVAVVDDSTFIRKAITRMLEDHPQIHVVGSAGSGEELLTNLEDWSPDVVTLDLNMPGMGGLATLDRLTALRPTPVIILSTHSGEGAPLTIEALHRGATDFIDKQRYSLVDFGALRNILLDKIFEVTKTPRRDLGSAEPIERSRARRDERSDDAPAVAPRTGDEPREGLQSTFELVVLGASTGGPPALQTILEEVGATSRAPLVIVQHMPKGFTHAFAERLNAYLPLKVQEARNGERLEPDSVYIAVAGSHLRVGREGDDLVAEVSSLPRSLIHVPSIDVLFESAARAARRRAIGVLLTGMGSDGAKGLAALKASGALTLCQDEETSVVFGMPRAALALDAAREVATPREIGRRLRRLVGG